MGVIRYSLILIGQRLRCFIIGVFGSRYGFLTSLRGFHRAEVLTVLVVIDVAELRQMAFKIALPHRAVRVELPLKVLCLAHGFLSFRPDIGGGSEGILHLIFPLLNLKGVLLDLLDSLLNCFQSRDRTLGKVRNIQHGDTTSRGIGSSCKHHCNK